MLQMKSVLVLKAFGLSEIILYEFGEKSIWLLILILKSFEFKFPELAHRLSDIHNIWLDLFTMFTEYFVMLNVA